MIDPSATRVAGASWSSRRTWSCPRAGARIAGEVGQHRTVGRDCEVGSPGGVVQWPLVVREREPDDRRKLGLRQAPHGEAGRQTDRHGPGHDPGQQLPPSGGLPSRIHARIRGVWRSHGLFEQDDRFPGVPGVAAGSPAPSNGVADAAPPVASSEGAREAPRTAPAPGPGPRWPSSPRRAAARSRTKARTPSDSSTPWIAAMLGWLNEARTLASRSKRARRSGSSARSGGRIFSATSRSSAVSWAPYTSPIPPSPIFPVTV